MSGQRRRRFLLAVVVAGAVVTAPLGPGAAARAAGDEAARIDVNVLRASGVAWVTASPFDGGNPADVFDGDPATLYRSAAVNPAFVQVTFDAAVTFTGFRTLFSHAGGDPAYQWKVEVADSAADMQCRCRSFAEVVPFTGTVSDQFSAVTLAAPVSARLVRLTGQRLTGDNFVHLDEWELIGHHPFNVLNGPRGVAAAGDGGVFVAESGADRVVRFAADGRRLNTIGTPGSAQGQLREPWDVAVDPCGDATVVDRGNARIQVFDPAGEFRRAFGEPGTGAGQLNRPAGIAIQAGTKEVRRQACTRPRPPVGGPRAWLIYVADTGNHRVLRLRADGSPDRQWGDGGVVGATGDVRRDHTGFDRPTDVAVNPVTGEVYVADFGNARLEVFDQQGRYVRTYLGVYRANALAFDPAGNLYIAGEDPTDGFTAYDGRLRRLAAGEQLIGRHYTGGLDDIGRIEGGVAVRPDGTVVFTDVLGGRVIETAPSFAPPVSDLRITDAGTSVTLRWRTALPGAGTVRFGAQPGEFTEVTEAGQGTEHAVTLTGRTPNTRLHYAVSFTDPFTGARRFTPLDVLNTGAPAGRTPFLRLKAAGVIYTDAESRAGYRRMDAAKVAEARARLRQAADFYWRNSGFRLWLDITIVEVNRDLVAPVSLFGVMQADLAARGFGPASNLDAAWGASLFADGNFGGGATLFGRFVGMAQWSTDDDFVAIHEINHSVDSIYEAIGLRKYEFNHGIWAVPGGVGRDLAVNGQILRNMLPANLTAGQAPFTKVLSAPDADADGVPDASPGGLTVPLRITEATLGTRTNSGDSDGDGVGDLAEATALPFHGTNPRAADTDGDGVPDRTDANPAYRMTDRVGTGTPVVDGAIGAGEGWTTLTDRFGYSNDGLVPDTNQMQARVTTYAAWDDRHLYLAVRGPAAVAQVRLDGDADNMFFGAANYWLTVSPGNPALSVRVNVGVPDLFRQIDDDGQFSEFFDTDPAFTRPYRGVRIVDDPGGGLGFAGRLVTESDLRFARGGSGDGSVWEVAIPWSDATLLNGFAGKRMALDIEIGGDRLFETDHQARIELIAG